VHRQRPAGQLPIQRTLKRSPSFFVSLTILPKGRPADHDAAGGEFHNHGSFRRDDAGWIMPRTIVRRLPNLSPSRELPGAQLRAFCRPKAWLLRLTGLRWESTRSLATRRGEHEPLLAGEDCGMSTPHGRGRYNLLRGLGPQNTPTSR